MMKMKKIISMVSAAVIAASMSAVTAVPASAANDTGWKSLYAKYLKQEAKKGAENKPNTYDVYFSLYDLDNDNTPELIESADVKKIITYKNKKLYQIPLDDYVMDYGIAYEMFYSPSSKSFAMPFTGSSGRISEYYSIHTLNNGIFEHSFDGIKWYYWENESYECKIGEKEVNISEFDNAVKKNFHEDLIPLGSSFKANDTDIKCAVTGGKNYKTLYRDFLKGRIEKKYVQYFRYADITGDNIPELFITDSLSKTCIYTYQNGVLAYLGDITPRFFETVPQASVGLDKTTNCICVNYKDESLEIYNFYRITDKGITSEKLLSKYYVASKNSWTYNINRNPYSASIYYCVKEISVNEYNSELSKYTKMTFSPIGKKYKLTEKNIKNVIK